VVLASIGVLMTALDTLVVTTSLPIDGSTNALWVGVGFSALGLVAALLAPTRRRTALASAVSVALAVEEPSAA
jgi:hypothetical protein